MGVGRDKWLEFPANVPAGEEYDDTELRGLISNEESARQLADQALQDQIDNLEIPDGGASSWDDLTDKPSEFPPSAHNHDGVYQPAGDYIEGDAPNDGEEYARKNQGWVKLQDHNYTGADAVKLTGDQTAAGHKTWTGIATFGDTVIMRGALNGDDTANFQNAVTAGSFVKPGGTSSQYLMADGSVSDGAGSGGGSGLIEVLEEPPEPPYEIGQQWFSSTDGYLYLWFGNEWVAIGGTA